MHINVISIFNVNKCNINNQKIYMWLLPPCHATKCHMYEGGAVRAYVAT